MAPHEPREDGPLTRAAGGNNQGSSEAFYQ